MTPQISVCMAIKNGEEFLREQIGSILPQLAVGDELIISDDSSVDESPSIVKSFNDPRIRLIQNSGAGLIANFETALIHARGRYLFLADQDDIWMQHKVPTMLKYLQDNDLVVSDCTIVNRNLEILGGSYFLTNGSGKGILKNLIRNSYMGCCMAFNRQVLERAIPFPKEIQMHDAWIGLISEFHFRTFFIPEPLVLHRRHSFNASTTWSASRLPWTSRITGRYTLLKKLVESTYVY